MTDEKRPLKVFLCHAHSDKEAVFALYDHLIKDGVDVWLDKKSLLPGQEWEYEIRKAVRESDVVVVCLSKQFNQAGFRQKEVRLALDTAMEQPEGEIFIIPARLEECDSLESLKKWHWVDLFESDGYDYLLRALHKRSDKIGVIFQSKSGWFPRPQPPKRDKPISGKKSPVGEKAVISQAQESIRQPNLMELKHPKKWRPEYIVAIIGAAATIIAGLLSSPLIERWLAPTTTPTRAIVTTVVPTMSSVLSTVTIPVTLAPMSTFTVLSPSKTPEPGLPLTEISVPEKTLQPTENIKSTPNISNNAQKIYFVSANKLNVLDVSSGQVASIVTAVGSYSSLFWFSDSEIASWSQGGINVINVETGANRFFKTDILKGVSDISDKVSDISSDRKFLFREFGGTHSVTIFSNSIGVDGKLGYSLEMSSFSVSPFTVYCMRWNPSGSMIAFTASIGFLDYGYAEAPALVVLGYGYKAQPIVVRHQVGGCISWSPDGKYIAFGNGGDFPYRTFFEGYGHEFIDGIYHIGVKSGAVTKLTDTKGYYPIWSLDGKTIAFLTEQGISTIDVETKSEKQIYQGNVSVILWENRMQFFTV